MSIRKIIFGWLFIIGLAVVDFLLVQSLILESNQTVTVAIVGAVFFCAGLEGGPALLGTGVAKISDKTRIKTGRGKLGPLFPMIAGGLCTLTTFIVYFFIRRDFIIDKGGFGLPHYYGYNGDLILMIVPFVTSFMAFGVSILITPHGSDEMGMRIEKLENAYIKAVDIREQKQSNLIYALTAAWNERFPNTPLPEDKEKINVQDTIDKIQGSIYSKLEDKLKLLVHQHITESKIITPFKNKYISIYRNNVKDLDYLLNVSPSEFGTDTEIGREWSKLQNKIDNFSNEVVQHFSTLSGGAVK